MVLSDEELQRELRAKGYDVVVTDSTRNILTKKLESLMKGSGEQKKKEVKPSLATYSSADDDEQPTLPTKKSTKTSKRRSMAVVAPPEPPAVASPRKQTPARTPVARLPEQGAGDAGPDPVETTPAKPKTKLSERKLTPYSPFRRERDYGASGSDNDGVSTSQQYTPRDDGVRPRSTYYSSFARRLSERPTGLPGDVSSGVGRPQTSSYWSTGMTPQHPVSASTPQTPEQSSFWTTSRISKALIFIVLIFFAGLAYFYIDMHSLTKLASQIDSFETHPENRFPLCRDNQLPGVSCVVPQDARNAMTELKKLVPRLASEAVTAICRPSELTNSGRDVPPGALSFAQIEYLLKDSGNIDSENTVASMRILARYNPHWGIAVLENSLIVTDPTLPTMCYVKTTVLALLYFLFICVPVLGAVTAVGWIAYTHYSQRYPSAQQVSAMVSRIQDTLNAHIKAGQNCATVSMIRDELIPAKDRKRLAVVWQKAMAEVLDLDKSMQLQVLRVQGEEVHTLVWDSPSPPCKPRKLVASQDDDTPLHHLAQGNKDATQLQRVKQDLLPGANFAPKAQEGPTPCLKIRNVITGKSEMVPLQGYMFEPSFTEEELRQIEAEEAEEEAKYKGRSSNTDWCSCQMCSAMSVDNQCVCCNENEDICLKKGTLECITLHEGFWPTTLNKEQLIAVAHNIVMFEKDVAKTVKLRKTLTNKKYRFLAYRSFQFWINSLRNMGKVVDFTMPACVVKAVRNEFPEKDGVYTCYEWTGYYFPG